MSFSTIHHEHLSLAILTYSNKNQKCVIICQFQHTSEARTILTYNNKFQKNVIICQNKTIRTNTPPPHFAAKKTYRIQLLYTACLANLKLKTQNASQVPATTGSHTRSCTRWCRIRRPAGRSPRSRTARQRTPRPRPVWVPKTPRSPPPPPR